MTSEARFVRWVMVGMATLVVLVGLGILAALILGAWKVVGEPLAMANLLGSFWDPLNGHYGLAPFVLGTVIVAGLSLLLAIPLALGVAVTLAQPASASIRESVTRVMMVFTAVPSVVFGWWGLQMVVPFVRRHVGGSGFSLLSAAIVLTLMVLPTLSFFFSQALFRVPRPFQEASLALGASADQTLIRVTLPCAAKSLMRGLMVGVARAVGETMAVQMVIGGQTALPHSLTAPGATLTTQLLTDMAVFPPGTDGHAVLDVMALMLFFGMYLLVRVSDRLGMGV